MNKSGYLNLLCELSYGGKFPAVNDAKVCKYRTEDGRKCVVGLLIPDEKYDASMEGETCLNPRVTRVIEMPDGVSIDQLFAIQHLHDQFATMSNWPMQDFYTIVRQILR